MLYGAIVRGASGPGRARSMSRDLGFVDDGVFKVPSLPVRAKSAAVSKGVAKGKSRALSEDVFADASARDVQADPLGGKAGKGKAKRKGTADDEDEAEVENEGTGELEKANRSVRTAFITQYGENWTD